MAERDQDIVLVDASADPSAAATIEIYQPRPVKMYTVIDYELKELERASSESSNASSFFWGTGGVFAGVLTTVLSSPPNDAVRMASFIAAIIVFGLATVWFGMKWYRATKQQNNVITNIKDTAGKARKFSLTGPP